MFGSNKTYFADSPVVIRVEGLAWSGSSPFNVVRLEVIYNNRIVGSFRADTGGQSSISFDISSALQAIWSGYTFSGEVGAAGPTPTSYTRSQRDYSLRVCTEYIDSRSHEFVRSEWATFSGGHCNIGWLTERERSGVTDEAAHMSYWAGTNPVYGGASTKPQTVPERVGSTSITSRVTLSEEGTTSMFFQANSQSLQAPEVLRDSFPYTDFLFVNRRGAVETCSAPTKEAMSIAVETEQYARTERPSFRPSRSLAAIASGGRRQWKMSSGHQTREWADWWASEFLMARQWWMLYEGKYVPVIVEPAAKQTSIYDRSKQNYPSVEFTVTMALEG